MEVGTPWLGRLGQHKMHSFMMCIIHTDQGMQKCIKKQKKQNSLSSDNKPAQQKTATKKEASDACTQSEGYKLLPHLATDKPILTKCERGLKLNKFYSFHNTLFALLSFFFPKSPFLRPADHCHEIPNFTRPWPTTPFFQVWKQTHHFPLTFPNFQRL